MCLRNLYILWNLCLRFVTGYLHILRWTVSTYLFYLLLAHKLHVYITIGPTFYEFSHGTLCRCHAQNPYNIQLRCDAWPFGSDFSSMHALPLNRTLYSDLSDNFKRTAVSETHILFVAKHSYLASCLITEAFARWI